MIALKAIQTSITATNRTFFYTGRVLIKRKSHLCLCNSNGHDSEPSPPPEGDTRKQEILAKMAMIEAQKARLTDYLDERSAHLTQFVEDANAEFEKIGDDALKGLDEASSRILENIETRMQAFEESAEFNRLEIEENENKLAAFEGQIEKDRNEGLFFKNLRQTTPKEKANAKEEIQKIKKLTKENVGSTTRKNIYLALIAVLVISIADSLLSTPDWRKVAVLGAILVALIAQFAYEQKISLEDVQEKEREEERE